MTSTNHNEFKKTVYNFINDLERYHSNPACLRLIEIYENLDMNRVLARFIRLMGKHELELKNQDETLFDEPCDPLPGLQLSDIFPKLASGQKRKIFNYLHCLLILSKINFFLYSKNPNAIEVFVK